MGAGQYADDLAAKAAEAVRRVVAAAEDRAGEILREAEAKAASIREQAEAEASQIRERAEADARGQIEAAKRALDELGGTLAAAATAAIPVRRASRRSPSRCRSPRRNRNRNPRRNRSQSVPPRRTGMTRPSGWWR